jgi:hypothetical protein
MKDSSVRTARVVIALVTGVVVVVASVWVVKGIYFKPSLCSLRDETMPSLVENSDAKAVAQALRDRADVLEKSYDTNDDEASAALRVLADGFNRLATELDNADSTWNIDTLVSELANDSDLNSANLTLESALEQCK